MKDDLPSVLVLTPMKTASEFLELFFHNLAQLDYDKRRISIGILEGDSEDDTWEQLNDTYAPRLREQYANLTLFKKDSGKAMPSDVARWSANHQIPRRAKLARVRNNLLFKALRDEDWVMWLDVEVIEYPKDVIHTLLKTGERFVHPHCVCNYGGKTFDANAWAQKGKITMDSMRDQGDVVELDAVGGTLLWIDANLHRDGLIFPPYLYGKRNWRIRPNNSFARRKDLITPGKILKSWREKQFLGELETEGLGIMASDFGVKVCGMPNLEILHYFPDSKDTKRVMEQFRARRAAKNEPLA